MNPKDYVPNNSTMTSALAFKLVKFDYALAFQITYQHHSVTNQDPKGCLIFNATNGISIRSGNEPDLSEIEDKVWLLGCHSDLAMPSCVFLREFDDNDERDFFHDRLLEAFAEWKYDKYFQIDEKKPTLKEAEDGYYEV